MVVIWGLDLKEMQWGKFKSSYMFGNTDYHLRRTKFVVYQLAMISCVVSESLGTAVLSDYVSQQKAIQRIDSRAVVYNNDFVGVASYNIFVGIYVATIFGSGFFFDLFWPERRESNSVKIAWKVCSVLACFLILATVIAETAIVVSRSAYLEGVDADRAQELLGQYGGQPLKYRGNPRAVASVVFAWIGLASVIPSTVIMWKSLIHNDMYGPFSSHVSNDKTSLPMATDEEVAASKMEQQGSAATTVPV